MVPVYFLHIPKTAGTSLNEVFSTFFESMPCAMHIEMHEEWMSKSFWYRYMFISGHTNFHDIKELVPTSFKTVTFLRHPRLQFLSHFQHLYAVTSPDTRHYFEYVGESLREFCRSMTEINLDSAVEFEAWLTTSLEENRYARRLLDNLQSRFLARISDNERFSESHLLDAFESLSSIPVVGITERMEESLFNFYKVCGVSVPYSNPMPRLNPELIKVSQINRPEIWEICKSLLEFDCRLYNYGNKLLTDRIDYLSKGAEAGNEILPPGGWRRKLRLRLNGYKRRVIRAADAS